MSYNFEAEEVTVSVLHGSRYKVDVFIDAEADDVFEAIKKDVDHDDMMACLTEEEVREYFEIEDEEVGK